MLTCNDPKSCSTSTTKNDFFGTILLNISLLKWDYQNVDNSKDRIKPNKTSHLKHSSPSAHSGALSAMNIASASATCGKSKPANFIKLWVSTTILYSGLFLKANAQHCSNSSILFLTWKYTDPFLCEIWIHFFLKFGFKINLCSNKMWQTSTLENEMNYKKGKLFHALYWLPHCYP